MINRSSLKYSLKKILPTSLFKVVLFIWQKLFLHIVDALDLIRLITFKTKQLVSLSHATENFKLYISPVNGFIDKHIYLYGVYEPFILDIISKYLQPGMTFIDIGANIGQHSMYAASIVGKNGSVYSFEPIPHVYEQLQDSSHANHFQSIIHAENFALGAREASETLYISKENIGGSSLVNEESGKEEITVSIKNGDNQLSHLSTIDMIKIDVEGYEYEVLLGIQESLYKHHPIILVEFSGEFYEKQGKGHGQKIVSLLEKAGYALYDIEDDMKEVTDLELFVSHFKNKKRQTNLLCIAN